MIALGSLDRPMDTTERGINKARSNLVEVLKKAPKLTADSGVKLLLGPPFRFEGYYGVNSTMKQTMEVVDEVNADIVALMIDTFHSTIEEVSILRTIKKAGKMLSHVHMADSNRLGPGFGSIDFKSILRQLRELDYRGFLCLECVPAGSNPDRMCDQSLRYPKSMEALSAAQVLSNQHTRL